MREFLHDLAHRADPIVGPFGGRTVVAHTPRSAPPIEKVNVWIDDVSTTLAEAMRRATECALAIEQAGLSISNVDIINWAHNVVLA